MSQTQIQPQPADFIITRMGRPMGAVIRVLQWADGTGYADYEHAALYLGGGWYLSMEPNGIQRIRQHWDEKYTRWSSGIIVNTPAQRAAILASGDKYYQDHIGYSFADYGALVAKRLHIPSDRLDAYIASTHSMICSQFVARTYYEGGHPLFDEWTGFVTPGNLDDLLDAQAKV